MYLFLTKTITGTDGTEVSGMEAIHVKQEMDHALAGPLTAKRRKTRCNSITQSMGNSDNFGASGALKDEVYCKDILPYNGILNLMQADILSGWGV